MKARQELNALLYRYKMDGRRLTEDMPHQAYALICGGDTVSVGDALARGDMGLLTDDRILSRDPLQNIKYHFVMSASAIASACMDAGMGQTEAHALCDLYMLKADEGATSESIRSLYKDMCLDFTERMQEIRKETVISLHIRRCIDYIYENLGADLSVNALAAAEGLHPAYLSRLFRQETGIPLKRFVKEARVDTAQNLLRLTDLSCSVISTSLGFSTQSVFIAVFKEIAGMTPKAYRDRYSKPVSSLSERSI
ncbi:MAG: helix-turn-helix transcriptional regulator [Oscillospiraceae bacterium]|nr:helix-turn-helix transcriptional regulator [Oscillospiraceae bacterium]